MSGRYEVWIEDTESDKAVLFSLHRNAENAKKRIAAAELTCHFDSFDVTIYDRMLKQYVNGHDGISGNNRTEN